METPTHTPDIEDMLIGQARRSLLACHEALRMAYKCASRGREWTELPAQPKGYPSAEDHHMAWQNYHGDRAENYLAEARGEAFKCLFFVKLLKSQGWRGTW